MYAVINVGGLAIGLTAFMLLIFYINHERSYDTWDRQLERVYQFREHHDFFTPDNKQAWQEINDSRIAALVRTHVPQFSHVTKVENGEWTDGVSLKTSHAEPLKVQYIRDADSAFFQVFPYRFLYGNSATALREPNTIVLKRNTAIQLFGTDQVLGKVVRAIRWTNDEGILLKITGIIAAPDRPESLKVNGIMHTGEKDRDPENVTNTNYCNIYALGGQILDTAQTNALLQKVYVAYKKSNFKLAKVNFNDVYKNGQVPGLKIVPFQDVHAHPALKTGWLTRIKPVVALSIFLLLVSVINFINLATAQSVQRAKEVGIKKVMGAYKKQLIFQFMLEAGIQTLFSIFLCVILVELLLPAFSNHFDMPLNFAQGTGLQQVLGQLAFIFLVVTLLAGFYPALVLANYNPVKVLKGNYEHGLKGVTMRNGLVVLQFVIAVSFIISIGVMFIQYNFVTHKDLGYNRKNLININSNYQDEFVKHIKNIPGVDYVATTTQLMGNTFNVPEEIVYKNSAFQVNTVTVSMDALPALGVQLLEGRLFSEAHKQDTVNSVILNSTAAKLLGKNLIGKEYMIRSGVERYSFQIVGIIKDYHNEGFEKSILPTIYKVTHRGGTSSTNNLLVRFNTAKYQTALLAIEREWKRLYPDFPMHYVPAEDSFQDQLKETRRMMQIIVVFSIISILLSLLGLFALSTFLTRRRTKEIAIRKILGASNFQIINMLNRSFLLLVVGANLISWPIAYVFTSKWLSGYAYRVDMPFAPFLVASTCSLIIAILTVSIQARKAAIDNPVTSLKYE
jgi:putative ABC transport system permease protein